MEKIKVVICTGTACFVMGGSDLLGLADHLPAEIAERVEIEGSGCLDVCQQQGQGKSPFVKVNGQLIADASVPKVIEHILKLIEH